jgi:hypothetical protein
MILKARKRISPQEKQIETHETETVQNLCVRLEFYLSNKHTRGASNHVALHQI